MLLTIGFLTLAAPALATTVIERTFPELVHRAEVIFAGTVTDINEQWDDAREAPFTYVTFSDLTVLKGDPGGGSITLQFLGGRTPEGMVLSIPGVPQFTIGEKSVVFCAGNGRDFCPLVGIWQGVLRVVFDPERGEETVSDNFRVPILGVREGAFLKRTPEALQQDALPLSELIQLVEEELRSSYGLP